MEILRGDRIGIPMTPDLEMRVLRLVRKYYGKASCHSLRTAYCSLMAEAFVVGYESRGGLVVAVLAPEIERPTFNQFKYAYRKNLVQRRHAK
jgi:hypothetical protein